MNRYVKSAICFTSLFVLCGSVSAQSPAVQPEQKITEQKIGAPPEASNMRLVGYNDLQARSAYQPTIHHQGDRYIAYIGHHGGTDDIPKPINPLTGQAEFNGTSIVDVTDPAHPKYLHHIPGHGGKIRGAAARRWCACATASSCPRAIPTRSTCCALFGGQGMRSGT